MKMCAYFSAFIFVDVCPLKYSPVSWGRRIHRLHLYRKLRPHPRQQVSWIKN